MTYGQFIEAVHNERVPGQHVIKDSRKTASAPEDRDEIRIVLENFRGDIVEPEFYNIFGQMQTIEFMQGAVMNEKPHYEKIEQFMCLVDGKMDIMLVPHVFRQEVYSGKEEMSVSPFSEYQSDISKFKKHTGTFESSDSSPVNFFSPNLKKFPHFKNVDKVEVKMDAGDCVFIPAYHYYQFSASNMNQEQVNRKVRSQFAFPAPQNQQ